MNTRTLAPGGVPSGKHFNTVQLIGPMRGLDDANRPAFHWEAERLRGSGYEVWSPAEMEDTGQPWHALMAPCIAQIPQSDALVALTGWEDSIGATIEAMIAVVLHKPLLEEYHLEPIDVHPLRQQLAAILPQTNGQFPAG